MVTGTGVDLSEYERCRRELLDAEADIQRIARELAEALRRLEDVSLRGREHLQGGGTAGDVSLITDEATLRPQLDERLEELRRARRRAKVLCIQLAAAEGLPLSEIGRRFGVSRQYVSKLLKRQPLGAPRPVSPDEPVPK